MSATSSADDPVQTVVDLLKGTDSSNWPNGTKPTYIERRWDVDFETKTNRADPAVYVHSPEDGTHEQLSAAGEHKLQQETVAAEIWAVDETDHGTVTSDVRAILEGYWNDRSGNTTYDRIRPQTGDDRRQEHIARRTDHYVTSIRIELHRDTSIGT
jgi:hypothetical protein